MSIRFERPLASEHAPYHARYIDLVQGEYLLEEFQRSLEETQALVRSLSEDNLLFRYAEGKWNIKEILLHISDAERIFAYRALRFARQDSTPLSGFDENSYVPVSGASEREVESLLSELATVRAASIALFRTFTPEMLRATGSASNSTVSVRTLAYLIVGHETHHRNVIKERYLH
ncbi:MAG: DinB family protein [Candidatus Kapaibacterium sp.]|nr:MAG: DinB family protein [Candidatus Kapabacteria bacterium]